MFESQFQGDYCILPEFFLFTHSFSVQTYPFFGLIMQYYLKSLINPVNPGSPRDEVDALVADYLSRNTMAEILNGPFRVDIQYQVLLSKSEEFFTSMRQRIGDERFFSFLDDYLQKTRFRTLSADDFIRAARDSCGVDLAPIFARWEKGDQLPAFLITDMRYKEIQQGHDTQYQVEFTVTNPEPVEGVLSVSLSTVRIVSIERMISLPGNQTKRIGIVENDPFQERVSFDTHISKNQPSTFSLPLGEPVRGRPDELFSGEQIIEPGKDISEPGVIIVDNEDPGFHTHMPEEKNFLRRMILDLHKKNAPIEYHLVLKGWDPPLKWQPIINSCFFGSIRHTAVYIGSGKGDCTSSWEAVIPESGRYEVLTYTPSVRWLSMARSPLVKDIHYTIHSDDGVMEKTLNLNQCEEGWTSLGTYRFSRGTASVELSDKSKGKLVFADAVKWVKRGN